MRRPVGMRCVSRHRRRPRDVVNSGAVQIVGHVLKPEKLEPTQDLMDRLKLPEGFKL